MNGLSRFFQMFITIFNILIPSRPIPTSRMKLARVFIRITMSAAVMGIVSVGSLSAQWSTNPGVNNPVSTTSGDQRYPQSIPDGSGGVFIVWEDYRSGPNPDVYAQRLDGAGAPLWTLDGVVISNAANGQSSPKIVSDNSGGAIITWTDNRNGGANYDIYAQRINAGGAALWTANGVQITGASGNQTDARIAVDGSGGAIIAWNDARGGATDIYTQKVNASGVVQWTADGVSICVAPDNQTIGGITDDGSGGAIITWHDFRNGTDNRIYAQRISSAGITQWTVDGEAVSTFASFQDYPSITSDGSGGAFIAWRDLRNGDFDLFAQRISNAGSLQWGVNGVAVAVADGFQQIPSLVADGSGGVFIGWYDTRSAGAGIYTQRLNSSGVALWTANGVAASTNGSPDEAIITSDGAGGIFVSWYATPGPSADIFAQRIDGSGNILWSPNGNVVCSANGFQFWHTMVYDGSGNAIVIWSDQRSGNWDIYAQLMTSQGDLGVNNPYFTVASTAPGQNARNISSNSDITVTFSQVVNVATLTASNIKVYGSQSGLHSATYTPSALVVTINPDVDFKPGEVVSVILTKGIRATDTDTLKTYITLFTVASDIATASFPLAPTTFAAGTAPQSVYAADFDGDGDMDIAIANISSNDVSILLNNGAGGFSAGGTVAVGGNAFSVVATDFDGDGDMDIAVANFGLDVISIRLNDGAGNFSGTTNVAAGTFPYSVYAADFDGDGDMDVASANQGSNDVSIRLNDGFGNFSGSTSVPVGVNPLSIYASDFDGDGDMDIATANYGSANVSIRLNDGNGNFSGTTNVAVQTNPNSVYATDFNGDGYADIAATNQGSNSVSIRLNDGSGNFSGSTNVLVGTSPQSVFAADFDGDGDMDIAAANTNSINVSIRLNDGAGNFSGTTDIAVGTDATSVFAADFDGDGDMDIATANNTSNDVSIVLNEAPPAAPTGLYAVAQNGQVELKWRDLKDPSITAYNVYSDNFSNPTTFVGNTTGGSNDTTFVIIGLSNGTLYYFRVTAVNPAGESGYSNEDVAVPVVRAGNAMIFDGLSDYAYSNIASTVTDNVTLEAWVKWDGVQDGTDELFLYNGNTFTNGYGLFIDWQNGYTIGGTVDHVVAMQSSAFMPVNIWTHVALVRDAGIWSLYVNGQIFALTNNTSSPNIPTGSTYIGADNGSEPFGGQLDEIRIWNVARTQAEIQSALGAPLRGDEAGMAALWHFDEPFGTSTIYDASPKGEDAYPIFSSNFVPSGAMPGPSLMIVNNTNDAGPGSLREAIDLANLNAGPDSIYFDISLLGQTINLNSNLPDITDDYTVINGDVDGNNTADVQLYGLDPTADKGINILSSYNEIRNLRISNFFNNASGIDIDGGNYNIITGCYVDDNEVGIHILNGGRGNRIGDGTVSGRNFIFNNTYNASPGIIIEHVGSDSNIVAGNFIGTEDGVTGSGNGAEGVIVRFGAKYNKIGDANAQVYNVISANTNHGILIESDSNMVVRNLIGTDSTGTVAMGNQGYGIHILNAFGNMIGDGTPAGRNILADNSAFILSGAAIMIDNSHGNSVLGNFIGTDITGIVPLPNLSGGGGGAGILLDNGSFNNLIGDGTAGGRNVLGQNGSGGDASNEIVITNGSNYNTVAGNYIGTDSTGAATLGGSMDNGVMISGSIGNQIGASGQPQMISGISGNGVNLYLSDSTVVINNFIGTDVSGLAAIPNAAGIRIETSHFNQIGTPGFGNIFSGNSNEGIYLYQSNNNQITSNLVGINADGDASLANNLGINLFESRYNQIGGNQLGERNIFSGNTNFGILFSGSDSNLIFGNYIGTDSSGTSDVGNGGFGILIENSNVNTIGENSLLGRNVISGNDNAGIGLTTNTQYVSSNKNKIIGNYIGTQADGASPLGNSTVGVYGYNFDPSFSEVQLDTFMYNVIAFNNDDGVQFDGDANLKKNILFGNSIYSNVNFGISYFNGSQEDILAPVITGILPDSTVQGKAAPSALVHIYADSSDEGQVFLDTTIADGLGNWSKKVMLLPGMNLTALQDSAGNTSQFSAPLAAVAPDPLLVTNTNDAGPGSLRDAITYSNSHAGPDTVRFDNTLIGQTINLFSSLVISGDSLMIDGDINADNAPSITLRGDRMFSAVVVASAHNIIKHLNFQNFNIAIAASGVTTHHSRFIGNYIGTNLSGNDTTGTTNNNGIHLQAGAYLNTIGDSLAGASNIISGSSFDGIILTGGSSDNIIMNNLVGLAIDGVTPLGNTNSGILINGGAVRNQVGSGTATGRNILSGNNTGVTIGPGADSNVVVGNYIGTDVSGNLGVANYQGILIQNSNRNTIGALNAGNVISANSSWGVWIMASSGDARENKISFNKIGTAQNGTTPLGNSVLGVRIYANSGNASDNSVTSNMVAYSTWAVEIEGNGPKADSNIVFQNSIFKNTNGGINLVATAQGFVGNPKITGILSDSTVQGTSSPNALVHIYADTTNQGEFYLDTTRANGSGNWSKKVPLFAGVNLTALQDSAGNTSMFSLPISAVYVDSLLVTNTNDAGAGSLRDVINYANTHPGPDTVRFSPALLGQTILLTTAQVGIISDSTVVDGDINGDQMPSVTISQTGDVANWGIEINGKNNTVQYLNFQNFNSGAGLFMNGSRYSTARGNTFGTNLNGTAAGVANYYGIQIASGAKYNTIGDTLNSGRNVISGNAQYGIVFQNNSDSNFVIGNHIGVDSAGTTAIGNPAAGIIIDYGPSANYIGNGQQNGRNIISGNLRGILIAGPGSQNNRILGNYIGTDINGTTAIPNTAEGVALVTGPSGNWIGNGTIGGRNIISGNGDEGIEIGGTNNHVLGNYLGTDVTGLLALPNASGIGVFAMYNQIGDGTTGGRNILSGNTQNGLYFQGADSNVVLGNFVGTDATGTTAIPNGTVGINIVATSDGNVIGNSSVGGRNLISGNNYGMQVGGFGNTIKGNFIGVDVTGIAALANSSAGIQVYGKYNQIGDGSFLGRNVISGNALFAVFIQNGDSNIVLGNFIGTDSTGTVAVSNPVYGIDILNGHRNIIGDTISGTQKNIISGNLVGGVRLTAGSNNVVIGNFIGIGQGGLALGNGGTGIVLVSDESMDTLGFNTIANNAAGISIDGANSDSNTILKNSIHNNLGAGIIFTGGAQGGVISPSITTIDPDSTVHGTAAAFALVQIYADSTDEGQYFLDSTYANGSGNWARKVTLLPGLNLTALQDSARSTSGFSAPFAAIPADPFVVTSTLDDSSAGTLRYAIGRANAMVGRNLITFSLPVNDTIFVTRPMPNITDTLDIDGQASNVTVSAVSGYTGFAMFSLRAPFSQLRNFNMFGRGMAQRGIFLDNAGAGGNNSKLDNVDALEFTVIGIQGDAVRDTIINSHIAGNTLAGIAPGILWFLSNNIIGTDAGGGAAYGVPQGLGIGIQAYGGITISQNLISGHSVAGIQIVESSYNTIFNNGIGTDVSATAAIPNDYGIIVDSLSKYNQIGLPGAGNVISGNTNFAINIQNNGADSNYVLANKIGTDITGTVSLGNAIGIATQSTTGPNFIGDGTPAGRNIISANSAHGLYLFGPDVVNGNFIGTDATGTADLGNVAFGAYLYGSNTKIINNVISGNDNAGVYIAGTDNHVVTGNFIGTDSTGNVALPNLAGITLTNVAFGSLIGGTTFADRNVISGNTTSGLRIENGARNISVLGNYVGLSADGQADLGNGTNGIEIDDASGNTIGNGTLNGRNFISGNDNWGVDIQFLADSNTVIGNVFGTDSAGTTGVGYSIVGVNVSGPFNRIGGYQPGQGNVIGGGIGYTVALGNSTDNLVAGNFMGVTAAGVPIAGTSSGFYITGSSRRDSLVGNTIAYLLSSPLIIQDAPTDSITFYGNKIHHNFGDISINALAQLGVQPPRITLVLPDSTVLGNAAPNALVQIFADSSNDGQIFLDTTYANGAGLWLKKVPLFAGMALTAMQDSLGNTSNFSAPFIPSFAPSAPNGLYVIARNGQVELKWNANTDGLTTKYRIYYDITTLPTTLQDSTIGGASDTSKTITGLTNGQIYYFRVAAVNSIGQESGFSNEDAAVPVVEAGNAVSINYDYVGLPSTFENLTMSISAWVKPITMQQQAIWANRGSAGTNEDGWALGILGDGTAYIEWGVPNGGISTPPNQVRAGEWTYITATLDGSVARIYINGIEQANGAYSRTASGVNAAIGVYNNGWGNADAEIDELGIWNFALSPVQVLQGLSRPWKGDETGLEALYHLDEPTGTLTAFDGTANAYNGTVAGSTQFVSNSGALSPLAPQGLSVIPFVPDSIGVSWNGNQESDLSHYIVYRSVTSGFTPSPSDSIGRVTKPDSMFTDLTALIGYTYYYRISGVDSSYQIGQYSNQVAGSFPVGTLSASIPAINFGNVSLGNNAVIQTKVFVNGGWAEITGSSFDFGTDFTLATPLTLPDTLLAGDTVLVDVRFTPTAFSVLTDTLRLTNNTSVNPFVIALDGTGTSGIIAALNNPENYGNVAVGSNTTQTIKVFSNGGAVEVSSANILSGTNFTIINALTFPDTLFVGDTLFVDVQFTPTAFGALTDTLSITNNSGVPVFKIALDGNGVSGTIASDVNPANYGNVTVGNNTTQTIKIYSNGGAVSVSAASILAGTDFTITNALTFPDTLFAGDTLAVDIQFAPTAFGVLTDTLSVTNNSGVPVFKVALNGSGITGVLAVSPASFNFGNVLVSDSLSQTFKVYSTGGAVAVNSSTLDSGSDFILENAPLLPDTLFDGDTLVFDIKFKPTAFGILSDTVRLSNNSSINPLKITLDGNGNAGTLATLNPTVNFGEVVVGDSVSQDIKLFAANGIVVVNNLNLLVGTHFTVSSAAVLPDTLFTGDTLNFTIQFKPLVVASSLADAAIFVNNSTVSPLIVSLEGSSLVKPVTPVTIVIYPEADARVSAVNPTTNYGSDPRIYVFGSNTNYQNNESHGYLRFDLSLIPADADVTQATFQIANSDGFAYNYDPNDYLHFVSDDSWNEATITWNTRPAVTNPPAASWFAWMAGTYDYTFSATSNVLRDSVRNQRQADGKISFNVNNGAGAYYNNYYSREGAPDNARRPQLIITYLPATLATLTPAVNNGNVAVGDSVTQTVKVFATAGSVTVNSTSLDFGANFTAVPQVVLPVTLNYGDTLAVDVQFTPRAFSSLTDTLVVNNNSGVPAFKVALNGTGVSGSIASNFNPANYGNVAVGNNATQTIKVFSNGGAVRVSAASILAGTNFTITNALTLPDTLFMGDTLSINVQFAPTAFGALTDTLSVINNSGVPVFKVALDGNGISGTLAASPSSFNFGNLQAGDSLQSTFKVYSVGGAVALTGTSLFAGSQFSIVSTAGPSTLFSGDTLIVNLKFKPLTVGLKNDTIRILNNSGVSPFKLAVSGTGSLGSLFVSANSLTFGSVQIGDSAQQSVKIYGSSNGIDVTNATLTSGVHFVIIPNQSLPVTLNIGDTLLATIRFKPKTFAAIVDTAQIINISVNNPLLISLSGTGSTGILAPLSANFGLVTIGDSAQRVLKLYTNSGAVIVDSLKFDFGTEFKFTTANSLPDTVFPGDTLFMGVQYKPLTFATTSDTIRVFNNSSQSVFNVRLNGVGNSGTLVVVPTSANFGNVLVGDSALQTLKVYATGANIIVNAGSMETGGDFTVVSTSGIPVTLVAGVDTLFVDVKFKPSTFGPLSDRLIITNNSLLNPVKINVTGTGTAGTIAASPLGYNFGNVLVTDSSQQSIKIYAATGRVIVNNLSLDNGIQFTTSAGSLPDTLATGDTLVALVKFRPSVTGIIRDTLRIGNNSQVSSLSLGFDGTGQSGGLSSNVAAYNFGNIKVGSNAQTNIKLYPVAGQVIISSLAIGTSGRYALTYSVPLPAILNASDTLVVTARFTPSGGGTILDTVYVGNNSVVSVYGVNMSGFGVVNSAPNTFASKQPASNVVVNTKTPTFTWEGRGDADGDTLRYTLQISKTSNFSSMVQFSNIADTAFTLSSPLDSLGTYYWRVSANDNQGGITVTNALLFNVDAVNPGLFVGVLASTILQNYIEVYVHSDEALNSLTGIFILRDASNAVVANDTLTVANLSGLLYSVPYKLSLSGELTMSITGVDTVGNSTTSIQVYNITTVSAKTAIALKSVDGYVTLSGAKESVDRPGYILVTRVSGEKQMSASLAKVISSQNLLPKELLTEAVSAWIQIGESVKILSTVEIKKSLTVTLKYDQSMIDALSQRYPDYSENKIGIYREDNGQWIYEGGEGNRETVTAKIGKSGTLAMFYNPEHVELPTRIELVQNYPNPFNPSTTIKFGLPDEGKIKLVIYNVLGQKVRELINESREAGFHTAIWNGKNDMGQQVSSGLYIYRLETLKGVQSKKMLLIK